MTTNFIEISKFTYFYEDLKPDSFKITKPFDGTIEKWQEIIDYNSSKPKKSLPFNNNFIHIWNGINHYTYKSKDNSLEIILHTFCDFKNKVIVLESKVKKPKSQIQEAIDLIRLNRIDIHKKIIKKQLPNWKGDYVPDGESYYFINYSIEKIEDDARLVEKMIDELTYKNGEDILTKLGFVDRCLPKPQINNDVYRQLQNDESPLIVISPCNLINRLVILDERLFVRSYEQTEDDLSLPIRLIITTTLYQKAFIDYASKMCITITDKKKSKYRFEDLSHDFMVFINNFWKLDISDSLYLNRSYRIIGKIWRLNSKFELLKDHLNNCRNIEEKKRQNRQDKALTFFSLGIGAFTLFTALSNIDWFHEKINQNSYNGFLVFSLLVLMIFALYQFVIKLLDSKSLWR